MRTPLPNPATWPRWLLLLLVAVAARAITFGNPIVHVDEAFYFTAAHAMLHGAWPYVDVWDRKPVGLFLLYLPAAALGVPLGIWAYQALALVFATLTAAAIARLADRAGWARGALPAAIAYLLWLDLADGQGGQAPVFYNLLVVVAVTLAAPRADDSPGPMRRRGVAALALVGLALQVKYSVLFEGAFLGLWLLWRDHRLAGPAPVRTAAYAAALVAVALAPTLVAWAVFAVHRHGADFVYANFLSILARQPDPWPEQLGNLATIALILSPLLAMAALSWKLGRASPARGVQPFLFAWLAASLVGLLAFGSWFDHYALPVLVPASCCAAGFLGEHRTGRRAALPILLIVLLGGQATLWAKRAGRGTPAQFARVVEAIGHGPGCLYVYSGSAMVYPYAGRCTLTRYLFASHLSRARESGATGVRQSQEVARIFAQGPAIVVMRPPYHGERPDIRALALARLRHDYGLRARLPLGDELLSIYARRPDRAAPRAATSPA